MLLSDDADKHVHDYICTLISALEPALLHATEENLLLCGQNSDKNLQLVCGKNGIGPRVQGVIFSLFVSLFSHL
jgi:hypothetical protein